VRARQAILAQNPELQERELIKMASWATAVAGSLRRRGVEDLTAALTAEAAVAAFRVAFETWVGPGKKRDLPDLIHESFDRLRERRWRQERL
jgi:transcriptional regulator MftR-like protein